jgi:hypothetical protein
LDKGSSVEDGAAELRNARTLSTVQNAKGRPYVSDYKSRIGGQDHKRISVAEDCEIRDRADRFGVTEEELRTAVACSGGRAEDVEREPCGRR